MVVDTDPDAAAATRRKVFDMVASERLLVTGMHLHFPGFGHIAFIVNDVPAARDAVLAAGGRAIGEVVTLVNAAGKALTWVYVTDPEGNVIELQSRPR